jgi:hypothetical protein
MAYARWNASLSWSSTRHLVLPHGKLAGHRSKGSCPLSDELRVQLAEDVHQSGARARRRQLRLELAVDRLDVLLPRGVRVGFLVGGWSVDELAGQDADDNNFSASSRCSMCGTWLAME